jgi:hypothetical protein
MDSRITPPETSQETGGAAIRDSQIRYVWNHDAPQGQAWLCPDCDSWATLGGNAGFHAQATGHRAPILGDQPARSQSPDEPTPSGISVEAKPEDDGNWTLRLAVEEIETLRSELRQLRAREQQALKESFMEGYNVGYSEGGNDAATFDCGGGSRSREYIDRTREEAWQVSETLAALALPAAQQQPAPAAEQINCPKCGKSDQIDGDIQDRRKFCHRCNESFPAYSAPSPAQEKPVEASVEEIVESEHESMIVAMAHDCLNDSEMKHILRRAINRALATASAPPAAAQETSDIER